MSYLLYVLAGLLAFLFVAWMGNAQEPGAEMVMSAWWIGTILSVLITARALQLLRQIRDHLGGNDD